MTTFRLQRLPSTDRLAPTRGVMTAGPHSLVTLEPPWKDNAREVSCIPVGTYRVTLEKSPRLGKVYPTLHDVPGRDGILCHSLNTSLETKGCIGVGLIVTPIGITGGLAALPRLKAWLAEQLKTGDVFLEILPALASVPVAA